MRPEGFDWDDAKHELNVKERRLGFDQATRVFDDPRQMVEYDGRFDYGEHRYKTTGMTPDGLLVVVHTERADDIIRIISARKAERDERDLYWQTYGER